MVVGQCFRSVCVCLRLSVCVRLCVGGVVIVQTQGSAVYDSHRTQAVE